MGADGVYARTALYEDVVERLAALITRHREAGTEVMRFPPVMSRAQLEKSGYLKSFPNLLGCVCGLHGTEREIHAAVSRFDAGGDWTTSLSPADLVLSPGRLLSGLSDRGEPAARCRRAACASTSPPTASAASRRRHLDRLQSFRMREYVCIGTPEDVVRLSRALDGARPGHRRRDLGLTFSVD